MTEHNPTLLVRPDWLAGLAERGGEVFGDVIDAMRHVQDQLASANAPPEVLADVRTRLEQLFDLLRPWQVAEADRPFGRRWDLPGRGQYLTPPLPIIERSDSHLVASMLLGEHYLGRNGAAHGGVIPLVFDEIMGAVANLRATSVYRTAYLNVNFRVITPIGRTLRIDSAITREDGRKRFISGRLWDGDTVLADAEGLFLALRQGQP